MMQTHWLSLHAPGVYALLKESTASFNEEQGEVALSILARSVMGNSSRLNKEKLRENFVLIHEYQNITRGFRDDVGVCSRRQLLRVDPHGEEIQRLSKHFKETIRLMSVSLWTNFGLTEAKLNAASPQVTFSDNRALQLNLDLSLYLRFSNIVNNLKLNNHSHETFQGLFKKAT